MTAEIPPPRPGRQTPDIRTIGIATPDLDELRRIRQRFTLETGLAYTIPLTINRIITEWENAVGFYGEPGE